MAQGALLREASEVRTGKVMMMANLGPAHAGEE
jgi:hypothetical protein